MEKLLLKSSSLWLLLFLISATLNSQNKSGNKAVYWGGGMYTQFTDTSQPILAQQFPNASNIVFDGHSNISDSATGNLLLFCNGYKVYNSTGNIIENGDSLQPDKIYQYDCCPSYSLYTQNSLILPKGSNGLYYVFTNTITDTTFTKVFAGQRNNSSYDLMQYHVVDINANNGAGKVIQKNVEMVSNVELSKIGMQAVRHANGYDWWLLKQGANTNTIYTFLVTKDSVTLDTIQQFSMPIWGYEDRIGQSCFSTDGSKYAISQGLFNKLFVADFDRCYGILSNLKIYNTPIDSSTHPFWLLDSTSAGVSFSPNDKFIYLTQPFHVYQFELNEPDSALAWYKVIRGADTTMIQFEFYGQLHRGLDERIYIGKGGGQSKQNSVINKPNLKGSACEFCRKCLRFDSFNYTSVSPANIPDFNLGALPYNCPPLNTQQLAVGSEQLVVFPNPSSTKIVVRCRMSDVRRELYNSVGQLILSIQPIPNPSKGGEDEIDVRNLSKGVYYLRVGSFSKKVIVE